MIEKEQYYELDKIGGLLGSQEKISSRRRAYILKKTAEAMQREREKEAAARKKKVKQANK